MTCSETPLVTLDVEKAQQQFVSISALTATRALHCMTHALLLIVRSALTGQSAPKTMSLSPWCGDYKNGISHPDVLQRFGESHSDLHTCKHSVD